jgi:cytochrome c1
MAMAGAGQLTDLEKPGRHLYMDNLGLNDQDVADIVVFLQSLTDGMGPDGQQ